MKYCIFLICGVFLINSCNEWKIQDNCFCEKFDPFTAKIGTISFVSDYLSLVNKLGEPSIKKDSCSSTSILFKQGYHYYDCLEFSSLPGVTFNLYKDTVFVSSINFQSIKEYVMIGNKKINHDMTIEKLVGECPNLQDRINKGASSAAFDSLKWIYIKETEDNRRKGRKNELELRFRDEKLVILIYDWQPSYTKQQWENYLRIKKTLDQ